METSPHIIEKLTLDMNLSDVAQAHRLKDQIGDFIREELLPEIEFLFDEWFFSEQIIRIDKLDIDLEIKNGENRSELRTEILNGIKVRLEEMQASEFSDPDESSSGENEKWSAAQHAKRIPTALNSQAIFLYFLEHGFLPWFGQAGQVKDLLDEKEWHICLDDYHFRKNLCALMKENNGARHRFVLQLPDRLIIDFAKKCGKLEITDTKTLSVWLADRSMFFRNNMLLYIVSVSSGIDRERIAPGLLTLTRSFQEETETKAEDIGYLLQHFKNEISRYFPNGTIIKYFTANNADLNEIVLLKGQHPHQHTKRGLTQEVSNVESDPTVISTRPVSYDNEKEPLFFGKDIGEMAVRNAGQVLFHPFLKPLFQNFGWLDDSSKILEEYRLHAVQTLHYCATGTEDFFEAELIFEKFLCGLTLDTPVPAKSLLNEEIKKEADHMLAELIRHWPELKNTSPGGIRQLFVHRDGKLLKSGSGYRLIVERKVQDVLLEKLRWNISIVKLPWLKELLFVEW